MSQLNANAIPNIELYRDIEWGAEQLLHVDLFKAFSSDIRRKIYSIGNIQILKRSAHAVIEGEPTRGLFLVLQGQLSVHKTDPTNQSLSRLASLGPGESFGELSLFNESPRSATVSAECLSHLFVLDAKRFETFLQQSGDGLRADFYHNCAILLSEKLKHLNADYISSQQLLWKYALRKETA